MVFTRNLQVSIRIRLDLLDIIDQLTESEFQGNRTNCMVDLLTDGLKLRKYHKETIEHPERTDELLKELTEKLENESLFDWIDTLDPRQQNAIAEHIRLNRE
jgi:hypothetical protein